VRAKIKERREPFERYCPHKYNDGLLPENCTPGPHTVAVDSALHNFCEGLCSTGGSWDRPDAPRAVAGFRLVSVQAVVHDSKNNVAYEHRQWTVGSRRQTGPSHFNFNTASFNAQQLHVLAVLRELFQERKPGTDPRAVNTFYSFHGTSADRVEQICRTGLVAVRETDAGYFGSGCYSTLNIEYALGYASGDISGARKAGPYPIIMFACSVGVAYPVTPGVDYSPAGKGRSDYFGKPLKPGFDCHVACVNDDSGYQAVNRDSCEYVEVVIDQESQMLPVAVLWFEKK
jgi:hypothetical protein